MTSIRSSALVMRLLVLVPVAALTLTACSLGSPGARESGAAAPGAADATTASEALAKAGLSLPIDAAKPTVEVQHLEDRKEAFTVTFTASPEAALEFCDQAGLGGARFVTALPSTAKAGLGDLPVTADSRWCDDAWSENSAWFRYVLVHAGDPATVHVSLQHMAR